MRTGSRAAEGWAGTATRWAQAEGRRSNRPAPPRPSLITLVPRAATRYAPDAVRLERPGRAAVRNSPAGETPVRHRGVRAPSG
ncbi:hypothetical protein ACWGLO_37265, partial [Streptomyces niveus]